MIPFCPIIPLLGIYPKEIILKKEGGVISKKDIAAFLYGRKIGNNLNVQQRSIQSHLFFIYCIPGTMLDLGFPNGTSYN